MEGNGAGAGNGAGNGAGSGAGSGAMDDEPACVGVNPAGGGRGKDGREECEGRGAEGGAPEERSGECSLSGEGAAPPRSEGRNRDEACWKRAVDVEADLDAEAVTSRSSPSLDVICIAEV